jgi:hypothetical protein
VTIITAHTYESRGVVEFVDKGGLNRLDDRGGVSTGSTTGAPGSSDENRTRSSYLLHATSTAEGADTADYSPG